MATQTLAPRIESSNKADGGDWISMSIIIADIRVRHRIDLGVLLRWATTSDGVAPIDGPTGRALADLQKELEAKDLIEPQVTPEKCEDNWFQDLNTGDWIRTKRAK